MTLDVQFKLKTDPNYVKYLRENSYWYKILTREPYLINDFIKEVKEKYKLRPIDKVSNMINTFEMMSNLISNMK